MSDLRSGIVPNWLTYPALVGALVVACLEIGGVGCADAFLGLAVALPPMLVLFAAGSVGGGDVKLVAAASAWLGYPLMLDTLVLMVVLGVLFGLVLLVAGRRVLRTIREFGLMFFSMAARGPVYTPAGDASMPFALVVFVAIIWSALGAPEALSLADAF